MPSNWAPSRSVVSKMSTACGRPTSTAFGCPPTFGLAGSSVDDSLAARAGDGEGGAVAVPATPPGVARWPATGRSPGMFDPVLVPVDLPPDRLRVLVGDCRRQRAGTGQVAVVHGVHGRHLGRR